MPFKSVMASLAKLFFLFAIPSALLLIALGTYEYAQLHKLFQQDQLKPLSYDQYTLEKTSYWNKRFDYLQEKSYNEVRRRIVEAQDHILEVRRSEQRYLIEYQYQVDGEIVEEVVQVFERGDETTYTGRYFIVKYHNFIEIVYFDLSAPTQTNPAHFQSEVCLQLPIEAGENVRYHIDNHNNIWIVTLSMNKVVFIQIYSCVQGRLIRQYRYSLKDNTFVNEIYRIVKKSDECMHIQVITYGLNRVDIEVCPYFNQQDKKQNLQIREVAVHKTNQIKFQEKNTKQWKSYTTVEIDTPLNELYHLGNYLLQSLGIDYEFDVNEEPYRNPIEDIQDHFDILSADPNNHYLIDLARNKSETGIIALDRFMINAKTPLFHGNPNYNELQALQLLRQESKGEKNPIFIHRSIDQKLNFTNKMYYKAAYKTVPNVKVEHLGLGDKALIFWPEQRLEENDYLVIRTKDGGLVTQKTELKGVYDKLPVMFEEIKQRIDQKPNQVAPGIYELHAKEQALISRPVIVDKSKEVGKLQLINSLSGKPIQTHYIKLHEGYRYTTSFLLNSQWWVLQYNPTLKRSLAKKYEFYVQASKPDKIHTLEMVYGNISSLAHQVREDDLSLLMDQFVKDQKNGYMLLNVYRCVDQYYYFQFTDADASIYGVARVHYQKMSNRLQRQSYSYKDPVRRQLMVTNSDLIIPKYDTRPYAVAINGLEVFKHIKAFMQKEAVVNQTWYAYCQDSINFRRLQKLQKYYYFPQQIYALGNYDCHAQPDEPNSESIFSFNMRNIIIHGRTNNHNNRQIKKNISYLLLGLLPVYLILLGLGIACCKRDDQKRKNE